MVEIKIRKIKDSEISLASEILVRRFLDYPLYKIYFPNEKNRYKKIKAFYLLSLVARKSYTLVSDDLSLISCAKFPYDKTSSILRSIFFRNNFFKCLRLISIHSIKVLKEYNKAIKKVREKFYKKENTVFIEALSIDHSLNDKINIFDIFKSYVDKNKYSYYCETSDVRLANLYSSIGFKIKDEVNYKTVTTYCLLLEKL